MSESSDVEFFLSQAGKREKEYDWLGAAEFYRKAIGLVSKTDFLRLGQVQERIGYVFYRAAMQAESVYGFRVRMRRSVANYQKAKGFYAKITETEKAGRMLRCDAVTALAGYWLGSEAQEKKKLTTECWTLAKDCLEAFEKAGDACEYGRAHNQLSTCIDLGFYFEWDFKARKRMMEEVVDHGERAIKFLSKVGDSAELARAYVKTANCLEVFGYYFVDLSEKEKYYQKAEDYLQKALEISEEAAMLEVASILFGNGPGGYWGDGTDSALSNLAKTLEYGRKTKDRFIIGCTLDLLAYHTNWSARTYDDRDERLEHFKKTLQYIEEARRQFCPISFISPLCATWWAEGPYTAYYRVLARTETDLSERRRFLEKALRVAPEELKRAESSGYPDVIGAQHHRYGSVLTDLAQIATNSEEKRGLLEKALVHMDETCRIGEQVEQLSGWNMNLKRTARAVTKSDLADLAKDHETRRAMLLEAAIDMETSLKLLKKLAIDSEKEGTVALFENVGLLRRGLGDLWIRLHEVSQNNEHLQRAIEAFDDAAESYEKVGVKSRVAECFWKAARAYDGLGNHLKAAENFEAASGSYRVAAEKVPKLKDFYGDYAVYMQAWNEIEKARHHHARQEYGSAKEHYEKAAIIHKSLKKWGYLGSNYSAWALVESAEDLSRREQSENAIRAFEQATNLFTETRESLQAQLSRIEDTDEKQMATRMLEATDTRREYCVGRTALEEAKILDKKGDHYSSSQKYDSAAQTFEEILQSLETEQDQKEFRLIITLSRAWHKMTLAEAESSSALYLEASQFFEQAKEFSPSEKTKMLVLGHSRFCKALEAGTRFTDSRDTTMHVAAVQHLASAASYYLRADFRMASEYAQATRLLLDAYLHMDNAEKETDPEKKTRLYAMAEKVLQSSADAYIKAKHPEKREQVLRLLEEVKEDRELALSLTEVLHAPSIVSATTSFLTPTPTHEEAVGLEKFEHANIQAYLDMPKEVVVGETFEIRLDMANVAKEPGLLVRIENLIPSNFKVAHTAPVFKLENGTVDMKGKRLEPQKVESMRIRVSTQQSGISHLSPRIVYVDEAGKFTVCQPDPVAIAIYPPGKFQFETNNAQKVFEYLTKAFVEDYMKKRLPVERSGWRTLMQIVTSAKTSKLSIYGTTAHRGTAMSELESRGVVEVRIFPGERGRGGQITKARVAYERDVIKRHIDEQVLKIREK